MPASGAPRRPRRLLWWIASEADPPHISLHQTTHAPHNAPIHHTHHSAGFTFGDHTTHLISSHLNLAWRAASVLSCHATARTATGMAWQRFLVIITCFLFVARGARHGIVG